MFIFASVPYCNIPCCNIPCCNISYIINWCKVNGKDFFVNLDNAQICNIVNQCNEYYINTCNYDQPPCENSQLKYTNVNFMLTTHFQNDEYNIYKILVTIAMILAGLVLLLFIIHVTRMRTKKRIVILHI